MGQVLGDGGALVLGEFAQAQPFGQILAQRAVGVFVGGAFPGVMRCREVVSEGGLFPVAALFHSR